jgi:hypothetical protein
VSSSAHRKFVLDLLQLQRERATGCLAVTAEDVYTVIYFENGRVVYADSTALSETLGRLMLDDGVIDQQQYTRAIDELRRARETDEAARLGGVLMHLGYVTVEDIQAAIIKQTGRRIAHLMQFEEPSFTFEPGAEGLESVPRYPMRVEPQILDGIQLYHDRARMARTLAPFRGRFVMLRADVELISRCFDLLSHQREIVASIDGSETTEAWLVRQPSEEALPILCALAITGVLATAEAPPSARTVAEEAKRNPSLAPPGNTGVYQVPEVIPVAPPSPRIGTPRRVLAPSVRKPRPQRRPSPGVPIPSVEQIERLEAEAACRHGLDLLWKGEHDHAVEQFGVAAAARPEAVEYRLYLEWAKSRQQPDLDRATLVRLEKLASDAARQDSRHPFPPYVTAHVALARGDQDTAYRFFKVALHRDPANKDARAQLGQIERRRKR